MNNKLTDEYIEYCVKSWFNCHPEEDLTAQFPMPLHSVINLIKLMLKQQARND